MVKVTNLTISLKLQQKYHKVIICAEKGR